MSEPLKMAIPVCKCIKEPDQVSLVLYDSFLEHLKAQNKSNAESALEAYSNLVEENEDSEKRREIEKDLASMEEYFSKL